jgi:hypothetical protein
MAEQHYDRRGFFLMLLLVFISRLPFLNAGYGGEEDAWGLILTAKKIATTGQYEVSRLPGHPVQEFIYAAVSNRPAWELNLITAVFSVLATGFFMLNLIMMGIRPWLPAGIAFAFVPVVFINSSNVMDYLWAQAFIMAAFYFLQWHQPRWCGLMLGIAAGCRITSIAMLLPFCYWIYDKEKKKQSFTGMAAMMAVAVVTFLIVYYPVYSRYGIQFFDYTARIPAPADKALFRATIGTWGVIGLMDLLALFTAGFIRRKQLGASLSGKPFQKKIVLFSLMVMAIYLFSFILLPHKAAFFIPVIPFLILLIGVLFPSHYITAFSFSMVLSSFFVSVNLDTVERAATPGAWSIKTTVMNRPVVIDFLRGPVIAEQSKRINKMDFASRTAEKIKQIEKPAVIIAGFWYNDVMVPLEKLPEAVRMVYYEPEDSLKLWKNQGKEIYFLSEQDAYNDLCYRGQFTQQYARPLP